MISSLKLACLCGVSQGTVDRALHARPGISTATRKRVLAMAEKHGYRPNPSAREMMTGESRLVGGIIPSFQSVFFTDLMEEVKLALSGRGLRLLLTTAGSASEFLEVMDEFAARRMRAAVVVPPGEEIELPARATRTMKVVTFLSPLQGHPPAYFVAPDEVETGFRATRWLQELGHRRIVHWTYERDAVGIRDRVKGYRKAMREAGGTPVVIRSFGYEAVQRMLDGGPSALFCHNDWLALRALRVLAVRGINVPGDISVLGVDHSPTFEALYPGLSTLEYPRATLAGLAAAWIAGESASSLMPCCTPVDGTTVRRLAL